MTASSDGPASDESLLHGVGQGQQDCAKLLTERYWEAIQRYCMSYLEDEALASDVTQETFAKVTSGEIRPEGLVKPWLYKVARNRCLDIVRRHQRSPTHHHRLRTGFDAARDTAGPLTRMAEEERRALIRHIIASMSEEYRSVLLLKHFEGFSRSEMAEALEITEATVKGRLVRASTHLREQLAKITQMDP